MSPQFDLSQRLQRAWAFSQKLPFGKRVYSRLLGLMVPYTATVSPHVEVFQPGRAEVVIRDKRRLRNHLRSVHAIALANAAELAGNLALIASMPQGMRFIVTGMDLRYLKKARGVIRAVGSCPLPVTEEKQSIVLSVSLIDANRVEVATATITSLVDRLR